MILLAIFAALAGCASPSASAPPPPPATPMEVPVSQTPADPSRAVDLAATLSLDEDGGALRVDYTISNRTDHVVYAADELLLRGQGGVGAGRQVVVAPGSAPGTVELLLAAVPPLEPLMALPEPAYVPIEGGAARTDQRVVPYPLQSWNNAGSMDPLPDGVAAVVFKVEVLTSEPLRWADVPLKDGRTARVPAGRTGVEVAQTGPLPLP